MKILRDLFCCRKITGTLSVPEFFDKIHTGSHGSQQSVQNRNSSHAFDNHHCAGHDDRIVVAMYRHFNVFSVFVYLVLQRADGLRRFEGCPEDNVASVTDAAQDTTGMIGFLADRSIFLHIEGIVVLTAAASGS